MADFNSKVMAITQEDMKQVIVNVNVRICKAVVMRMRFGLWVVRLGLWITGMNWEVEGIDDD
jgi:hypothetical protein